MRPAIALAVLTAAASLAAAAPALHETFDTLDAWKASADDRYTGKVKLVKSAGAGAIQVG